MSSAGIDTAAEIGTSTPAQVRELAIANDHADADALLIPDTAMHTLAVLPELETALGKPVLTANQVTIWEGLRLAGGRTPGATGQPGRTAAALGTLFPERRMHARR